MRLQRAAAPAIFSDRLPFPMRVPEAAVTAARSGFTLIEVMIALLILGIGLLATGQLIFAALSSASLARSKANAALVAQNKLECLGDLCRRSPDDNQLTIGGHDGEQVEFASDGGAILNRFKVSWIVSELGDPREGLALPAKLIRVSVSPIDMNGNRNNKVLLNKTVDVSCVFYTGVR